MKYTLEQLRTQLFLLDVKYRKDDLTEEETLEYDRLSRKIAKELSNVAT